MEQYHATVEANVETRGPLCCKGNNPCQRGDSSSNFFIWQALILQLSHLN